MYVIFNASKSNFALQNSAPFYSLFQSYLCQQVATPLSDVRPNCSLIPSHIVKGLLEIFDFHLPNLHSETFIFTIM